jgi:hypothetical protein
MKNLPKTGIQTPARFKKAMILRIANDAPLGAEWLRTF